MHTCNVYIRIERVGGGENERLIDEWKQAWVCACLRIEPHITINVDRDTDVYRYQDQDRYGGGDGGWAEIGVGAGRRQGGERSLVLPVRGGLSD